jgi:hypothetical protein
MALNDYLEIQQAIIPPAPPKEIPQVNRSEQVSIGLEFAKRQAEKVTPEQKPIPSAGAAPIAN